MIISKLQRPAHTDRGEVIRPAKLHRLRFIRSTTLAARCGADEVMLAAENLQVSGAYKIRGATNKIAHLSREETDRGVIAASAGNHAQGVAIAATSADPPICCFIVMPRTAPHAKTLATAGYLKPQAHVANVEDVVVEIEEGGTFDPHEVSGSRVILYGQNFNEAYPFARQIADSHQLTFIEPYDDLHIIAGQGTIGIEIDEQYPQADVVLVGIGGGGLISGIAISTTAIAKERNRVPPEVIGIEAEGAASMYRSLEAGERIELPEVATIADGIMTKSVGKLPFQIVQRMVGLPNVTRVSDREIMAAIVFLVERGKLVVEGAGAVGVAALLSGQLRSRVEGKRVVALLSGGNIDVTKVAAFIQATQAVQN